TVNNLAEVYQSQKQYNKAEYLYQRALSREEKQLGPQFSSTLTIIYDLATIYWSYCLKIEAEALYKRALAGARTQLGLGHPHTVAILESLTDFMRAGKCVAV
ncbi:hypothetical protein SERLA73DRAFT_45220, partial [Serpula lacrymans var. lacrymans S7.3]